MSTEKRFLEAKDMPILSGQEKTSYSLTCMGVEALPVEIGQPPLHRADKATPSQFSMIVLSSMSYENALRVKDRVKLRKPVSVRY